MIYELIEIDALIKGVSRNINGRWVPARPMQPSGISIRIRAAWMVFTGKADAVVWPEGQ